MRTVRATICTILAHRFRSTDHGRLRAFLSGYREETSPDSTSHYKDLPAQPGRKQYWNRGRHAAEARAAEAGGPVDRERGCRLYRETGNRGHSDVWRPQDLTEAERYKLRFDVALRTKLIDFLSFRVGLRDAYDNSPPVGANKNELIFLTGLGLGF